MELGGLNRGTGDDALTISGLFALNGALEISLINGFTAAAGNSFDLFDWGSLAGTFDTVTLPSIGDHLDWNTSMLYHTGVISVLAVPEPGAVTLLMTAFLGAGMFWFRRIRQGA